MHIVLLGYFFIRVLGTKSWTNYSYCVSVCWFCVLLLLLLLCFLSLFFFPFFFGGGGGGTEAGFGRKRFVVYHL